MHERIQQLADQITALENELQAALEQQEDRLRYQIEGRRITFERAIREAHRKVKIGVFRWFLTVRPQNFLTAPVIYGMIVPLVSVRPVHQFLSVELLPHLPRHPGQTRRLHRVRPPASGLSEHHRKS